MPGIWSHGTNTVPPSRGIAWAGTGIVQNVPNGHIGDEDFKGQKDGFAKNLYPHAHPKPAFEGRPPAKLTDPLCSVGYFRDRGDPAKDKGYHLTDESKYFTAKDNPSLRFFKLPSYPTKLYKGKNIFSYYIFAGHPTFSTGYVEGWITKKDYDGGKDLTWGDLHPEPLFVYQPTGDINYLNGELSDDTDDGLTAQFEVEIDEQ